MSGQSPAERLREAARVLRERGEPEDSPLGLALADWPDDVPPIPGDWERVPTARDERAPVLALLADPAVVEAMAHAHYRNQMPDADDWAEESAVWRVMHRADMQAALDVLRARIEEDR